MNVSSACKNNNLNSFTSSVLQKNVTFKTAVSCKTFQTITAVLCKTYEINSCKFSFWGGIGLCSSVSTVDDSCDAFCFIHTQIKPSISYALV